MLLDQTGFDRKSRIVTVLDEMMAGLEISPSQRELAQRRYEAAGNWLAESGNSLLRGLFIYLQGSTAVGTTVKPIGSNEHDVDLVAHRPSYASIEPAELKKAIGDRLRENGHYAPLLEEMPRCWRLVYANEFHMDITPAIPNPACGNGGELVPDKAMRCWKASNPKGYREAFERRAAIKPQLRLRKLQFDSARPGANVEPYPQATGFKGILRRIVQIAKRHRDIHFLGQEACLAPISVIVTTLAAWAYEYCVSRNVYDSELDLACDVIRHMPSFIEERLVAGRRQWFIWNDTTEGENFAEKWNGDPRRAEAFFTWHRRLSADLDALSAVEGMDRLNKNLRDSFGQAPVDKVFGRMTDEVSSARRSGLLGLAPAVGLSVATSATPVRANTFFGALVP
ncbi:nucleotidyltransferase domain-containing protein [Rhizorhapis sp. SPR117]|uniref:nucleotidyltransferase domain-containing protein n=1 Tax=Rhizorhapis sp. SPR117 TaxID=2912611 RepID=UPI001F411E02|nr:nucleotidyltransferase [Rhizorhapis sp. SPR117]